MSVEKNFVELIFKKTNMDKGFKATMKQVDNEAFEWKFWYVLNSFVCRLENRDIRKAFAVIGSSIAKSTQICNGSVGLGRAIAMTLRDSSEKVYPPRLMKLLSIDDSEELLDFLRPTLSFLSSKGIQLDYSSVLSDVIAYIGDEDKREAVKVHWVSDFLSNGQEAKDVSE